MKLYVGRHAFAGKPSDDPKVERDRPLVPLGRQMAKAVAQAVIDADEVPNVIFASPFARAIQTADIYGKAWGVQVNVIGELSPVRPLEGGIIDLLSYDDLKKVMILGHVDNTSPAMENLGGDVTWEPLVMAEIRRVEMDRKTGEWKLKWGVRPSDLGLVDIARA